MMPGLPSFSLRNAGVSRKTITIQKARCTIRTMRGVRYKKPEASRIWNSIHTTLTTVTITLTGPVYCLRRLCRLIFSFFSISSLLVYFFFFC